jgi:hypothetical protein
MFDWAYDAVKHPTTLAVNGLDVSWDTFQYVEHFARTSRHQPKVFTNNPFSRRDWIANFESYISTNYPDNFHSINILIVYFWIERSLFSWTLIYFYLWTSFSFVVNVKFHFFASIYILPLLFSQCILDNRLPSFKIFTEKRGIQCEMEKKNEKNLSGKTKQNA